MKLSVVIVNYNVRHYLYQCLESLKRALKDIDAEVFVVDNHSRDGSIGYVRGHFPEVNYVESNHNLGFARANNIAIRQTQGSYVLLLNPDTIVAETTISEALTFMDDHPEAGGLGVRMLRDDGFDAKESRRGLPTPSVAFYKMSGLCSRFPKSRRFGHYYMGYLPWDEPAQIEVISGAFCLLRREALDKIGLLDEDFFMYGEDIDLSYRLVKAGKHNWYLPVEIIHYKGESTKKDSMRYVRVFYEAMLIFYRKHYPRFSWIGYPIVQLGVAVRASMAMLKRIIQRILPNKSPHPTNNAPWVILSDNRARVTMATGLNHFKTAIPQEGPAQVLIDDATHSYSDIVNIIATNARKGVEFHIFSAANELIITPKMSQA